MPNSEALEHTRFLRKVFMWMFAGLILSGLVAYWTALNQSVFAIVNDYYWILVIIELGIIVAFASLIQRKEFSGFNSAILFLLYSAFAGFTLSFIFVYFTIQSIALTFYIASGMFAMMAVFGYLTKVDLTRLGSLLLMGLIGLIIAYLINMFIGSEITDYVLSFFGVIIFTGLTAYDV